MTFWGGAGEGGGCPPGWFLHMHASSKNQTRMVRSVETQTSPYIVNIIVFHGLLTIRIWFDDIVVEKFNYINII